jgi:hypothetical protein
MDIVLRHGGADAVDICACQTIHLADPWLRLTVLAITEPQDCEDRAAWG